MKRALVTGGSGAIGAAICRRLAADGMHVIIHANNNLVGAQSLCDELMGAGLSAQTVRFDVADADATLSALEALLESGSIQVLVNNAGIHDDAVFPGMQRQQWHKVIDISLHGFFNVTQPLSMPMIRSRWGRIITISSIAGITGNRGQTNYAAAKGALHAASKSLALELATRGITVNAVAPGIINSDMTKDVFDSATIANLVPMKRAGKPEEVAALVGFLASDAAAYITGQVISVNGGMV
jgi:3-oxoacyl-[acyl-carrier protein] reductase